MSFYLVHYCRLKLFKHLVNAYYRFVLNFFVLALSAALIVTKRVYSKRPQTML